MTVLSRDRLYSRQEISDLLGGNPQWYLPRKDGRVVSGCFDPSMNLRAPVEVDVGAGDEIRRSAKLLLDIGNTIPVFLKHASRQWRYVGDFRAVGLSMTAKDLSASWRRPDATAVLFLEEATVPTGKGDPVFEVSASEGSISLRLHRTRERKRGLVDAKKRMVLAESGVLICEACGHRSLALANSLGDACFEVHHLVALSAVEHEIITRLDDLALLCANCHRMIHATEPLMDLPTLQKLLRTGLDAPPKPSLQRAKPGRSPGFGR
jgi:hypothetical protein